jgi:hypothetical protein
MNNRLKFRLGVIFCIIGLIILISSLSYGRFIPGGFISLGIGIILISESRKKSVNKDNDWD